MIEGRVTPLFDMMPGLDLEDSGYENIVTAGLLFGTVAPGDRKRGSLISRNSPSSASI